MGTYFHNYLGAFLVIKNKEVDVKKTISKCTKCNIDYTIKNNLSKIADEYNFCSKCGGLIGTKNIIEKETVTGWEEIYTHEEFDDLLFRPEYPNSADETYALVNSSKSLSIVPLNEELTEFDNFNGEFLKNEFKKEFKAILEALTAAGFEYEIKTGLVNWGS